MVDGFEGIDWCSRCGLAVDLEKWAQALANEFKAPVLGQLAGLPTFLPEEKS